MKEPKTVQVCVYDAAPDHDTPHIYVFSSYRAALRHACDEISENRLEDFDEETALEMAELLDSDGIAENEAALTAYAEACEGGRFVLIEERTVDDQLAELAEARTMREAAKAILASTPSSALDAVTAYLDALLPVGVLAGSIVDKAITASFADRDTPLREPHVLVPMALVEELGKAIKALEFKTDELQKVGV